MPPQKSEKKVAIISGATGYVGSAIATQLASDGFGVAVLYHSAAESTVNSLLSSLSGSGHAAYHCNLTDPNSIAETLSKIEASQGKIYVCVHAAWTKPERKQLINTPPQELLAHISENVQNSFNFLTACAQLFKQQRNGIVIGITTAGVLLPEAVQNLGAYIPAKYALQGILAAFKQELRASNIRVYSVAPDFMEGGMNKDIPKAFVEMIKLKTKASRLTTAEDVAKQVSFLCSDEAKDEDELTFLVRH